MRCNRTSTPSGTSRDDAVRSSSQRQNVFSRDVFSSLRRQGSKLHNQMGGEMSISGVCWRIKCDRLSALSKGHNVGHMFSYRFASCTVTLQCEVSEDEAEMPICFPARLPKQVYHGLGRQRVSGISPFDSGFISGPVQSGSARWRDLCFGTLAPSLHESAFLKTQL